MPTAMRSPIYIHFLSFIYVFERRGFQEDIDIPSQFSCLSDQLCPGSSLALQLALQLAGRRLCSSGKTIETRKGQRIDRQTQRKVSVDLVRFESSCTVHVQPRRKRPHSLRTITITLPIYIFAFLILSCLKKSSYYHFDRQKYHQ